MNISHLRSKYRREIEIIREKVQSENFLISLSGIDEIIKLLEKLNLKERSKIQEVYLEKILEYAILYCQKVSKDLIDESHIKKAFQDIYRTETDMMRKIQSIERIGMSELEKPPEELETLQEVVEISTPEKQTEDLEKLQEKAAIMRTSEEQAEKFEVIQEEEVFKVPDEIPIEQEVLPKKVVVSKPEEQPEELVQPGPKIINCPFCGLEKDETATFCRQCGMIFKNK